jgi:hypothetical protein
MLFDDEGNLLVGLAPDHTLSGAILLFDFDDLSLTPLVSNIGSPTGLAYIAPVPEPASWLLAALGAAAVAAIGRRRRRARDGDRIRPRESR